MIARCRFTTIQEIKCHSVKRLVEESVRMERIGLEAGRDYWIEGVIFRDGVPWFYLCEELDSDYPVPHCSIFFDLIDPVLPPGWKLLLNSQTELVPSEWGEFPNFYEHLIDGDPKATALFSQIRRDHNLL